MRSILREVGIQRTGLIVPVILAGLLLALSGCQGLPSNVANCTITPTPALKPFHRSTGPGTTARGSLRLSSHHLWTNNRS
jgi:hypothetical protein